MVHPLVEMTMTLNDQSTDHQIYLHSFIRAHAYLQQMSMEFIFVSHIFTAAQGKFRWNYHHKLITSSVQRCSFKKQIMVGEHGKSSLWSQWCTWQNWGMWKQGHNPNGQRHFYICAETVQQNFTQMWWDLLICCHILGNNRSSECPPAWVKSCVNISLLNWHQLSLGLILVTLQFWGPDTAKLLISHTDYI